MFIIPIILHLADTVLNKELYSFRNLKNNRTEVEVLHYDLNRK